MEVGKQFAHQPEQMQLFMTGTELKNRITDSIDRSPMGSMEQMWKSKLRQSKRSGMGHGNDTYASIKEHGWNADEPQFEILHVRQFGAIPEFDTDRFSVSGAHHRIAAAADIEARSKGKREIYFPTIRRDEYPSLRPPGR